MTGVKVTGDLTLVPEILGQAHNRHPDLTLYGISAFECSVESGDGVGGTHALKMRLGPPSREQVLLSPDRADALPDCYSTTGLPKTVYNL